MKPANSTNMTEMMSRQESRRQRLRSRTTRRVIETAKEKSGPTAGEKIGPTAGEKSNANSRQRRRKELKMTTQSYKTTGRCTHATMCTGSRTRSSSSQQMRPRNRQSHLRRTCQQNTAETQQVRLSSEDATSRCETTGADGPDSAGKPRSCSSSIDETIEIPVPQRQTPVHLTELRTIR